MMEFYQQLKPFTDFDRINDPGNFARVPTNWVVLVSDIKGSTRAVREGRFKDVNMLGAAAITIVANELKGTNTISIFGGDGATILLPAMTFEKLRRQFVGLIHLAEEKFRLEMRLGMVPISHLEKLNCPVFVGKYQVSSNTVLSQLMGAGVGKAESLIKGGDSTAVLLRASDERVPPDLHGLSCRMDRFASRNGKVLSIIVKPKADGDSEWIRQVLLRELKQVLNNDFHSGNPVTRSSLNWRIFPQTLSAEIRLNGGGVKVAMQVLLRVLLANLMLKLNISLGGFAPTKYKSEVPLQSDFKKFDDCLRMVIDCNDEQATAIVTRLKSAYHEGRIFYGVYESASAVVTCLTYSASSGDHVHFVDGEGCGYTMASVGLKEQLRGVGK